MGPATAVLSYDARYGGWTRRVLRRLQRLTDQATKPLAISGAHLRRALAALRPDDE